MRGLSNFCDFLVILSASSARQAQTISDNIKESLHKKHIAIRAQEGGEDSQWIVLDLFDVVVHIFYSPLREYYNLEKLWQDAPLVKLPVKKDGPRRMSKSAERAHKKSSSTRL